MSEDFDLSTATPVISKGDFDLSTAQRMGSIPPKTPMEALERLQPSAPKTPEQLPKGNPITGAIGTVGGFIQNLAAGVAGNAGAIPTALAHIGGAGREAEEKAAEIASKFAHEPLSQTEKEYTEKLGSVLGSLDPNLLFGVSPELAAGVKGQTSEALGNLGARVRTPSVLTAEQNLKNDVARKSIEAGYVIPPSQAVEPTLGGRAAEAISGKIQTAQKFSEHNQANTVRLAKEELGISPEVALTPEVLDGVRAEAGKAYEALKNLPTTFKTTPKLRNDAQVIAQRLFEGKDELPGLFDNESPAIQGLLDTLSKKEFSPSAAVAAVKKLRQDSKVNLKNVTDGEKLELGRAQKMAADAMEDMVEQNLSSASSRLKMYETLRKSGMSGVDPNKLLQDFRNARTKIAKSYSIQDALGPNGTVYADKLGTQLGKNKPLSGNLKKAAEFARTYPKANQNVEKVGSQPGWSPLDVYSSVTGAGTGAYLGSHIGPVSTAVGAILGAAHPIARPLIRNRMMKPGFQNSIPVKDVLLPPSRGGALSSIPVEGGVYLPRAIGALSGIPYEKTSSGSSPLLLQQANNED